VKKLTLLVPTLLLVCVLNNPAQDLPKGHMSPPPPPLDPERANQQPDTPTLPVQRHVDLVQLQKDADDLARTAQTIPVDVANVRRGVLPKDTVQKLKQIEKLSKHLRSELNP
jgi:hypothetical protein